MPLPAHFPAEQRLALFDGRDVSSILPYPHAPQQDDAGAGVQRFSISGTQLKNAIVEDNGTLRYAEEGEQSRYILKPRPHGLQRNADAPANEWVSMTMAQRLFRLETAACGLCYFGDGRAAYLTRRFDIAPDGTKLHKEDLMTLSARNNTYSGDKYESSYEEAARLISTFSQTPQIDLLLFFKQVVVSYLLCNGDAHLKNFSLLEDSLGQMHLAPVYDLMNTRLHVADGVFALQKGLFESGAAPIGNSMGDFFLRWGQHIGIAPAVVRHVLKLFANREKQVTAFLATSPLSEQGKRTYLYHIRPRFAALRRGL